MVFRGTDLQVTTAKLLLPSSGVPTSPDVCCFVLPTNEVLKLLTNFEFCYYYRVVRVGVRLDDDSDRLRIENDSPCDRASFHIHML